MTLIKAVDVVLLVVLVVLAVLTPSNYDLAIRLKEWAERRRK